MEAAERLYSELLMGVEVVLTTATRGLGKFKDADLIGFPIKVTIGAKGPAQNKVEVALRRAGSSHDRSGQGGHAR